MLRTILLIDDDSITNFINQRLLKKVLNPERIIVATHGQEGLDILKGGLIPDLIFLDINMPVMDGFEFLENFNLMFKENPPRVIVLTTSEFPGDIRKIRERKVKTFLNKPLTEKDIMLVSQSEEKVHIL